MVIYVWKYKFKSQESEKGKISEKNMSMKNEEKINGNYTTELSWGIEKKEKNVAEY